MSSNQTVKPPDQGEFSLSVANRFGLKLAVELW